MKVTAEIELTPEQAAEIFCEWGDEEQAQFFIEAARIAETWDGPPSWQWYRVGRHLHTCKCATPESRDMVQELARGTEVLNDN